MSPPSSMPTKSPFSREVHVWMGVNGVLTLHLLAIDWVNSWLTCVVIASWLLLGAHWFYCFVASIVAQPYGFEKTEWQGFILLPLAINLIWLANDYTLLPRLGIVLLLPYLESAAIDRKNVANNGSLRFGPYRAIAVQGNKTNVHLAVASGGFLANMEIVGFARCPMGCFPQTFNTPEMGMEYAETTKYTHLSGPWYWWKQQGGS